MRFGCPLSSKYLPVQQKKDAHNLRVIKCLQVQGKQAYKMKQHIKIVWASFPRCRLQRLGASKIVQIDFMPKELVTYSKETQTPATSDQPEGKELCYFYLIINMDIKLNSGFAQKINALLLKLSNYYFPQRRRMRSCQWPNLSLCHSSWRRKTLRRPKKARRIIV